MRTISMNDLIKKHHIDRIDILKVDIEGGEIEIFSENLSWLTIVRILVIEIHDKYIDGDFVRKKLHENGFKSAREPATGCEIFLSSIGYI